MTNRGEHGDLAGQNKPPKWAGGSQEAVFRVTMAPRHMAGGGTPFPRDQGADRTCFGPFGAVIA